MRNYYKAVCQSTQNRDNQKPPKRNEAVHKIQHKEPYTQELRGDSRNVDSVNIQYLNFNSVRLVIFTILELGTSQKRTGTMYKIYTGNGGNLMPFRLFKILFQNMMIVKFQ